MKASRAGIYMSMTKTRQDKIFIKLDSVLHDIKVKFTKATKHISTKE